VTGKEGRCVAIGGGTYVHELKNGVAFGAVGETTDTHMHGPDEFMPVAELQDAAVIYALSILDICG
jgi:succinyl-diaminopimelate desuccinylase